MAKKQINPQLFRVGITQNWTTTIKLENYSLHFFYVETIQNRFSEYWSNQTIRKLLIKRSLQYWLKRETKRVLKRRKKESRIRTDTTDISYLQILKKQIESRRRGFLFRVTLARLRFLKSRRMHWLFYPRVEYWYKKLYKGLSKKKNILRSMEPFLRAEKQIIWYRNYVNMEISQFQTNLRGFLRSSVTDAQTSIAGSTVLRRYQCNISAIQPPFWTRSIRLKHASFKKIVGYVRTWRPERGLGIRYLILLSRINLALQWRSSFLFINLIKNMLEQQRRVQGSLRLVHELLNRMNLTRYNILCIKMKIIGSFGKITRSKTIKLGRIGRGVSHSVTNLSQPVSYASTQIITIRGVLGLRV